MRIVLTAAPVLPMLIVSAEASVPMLMVPVVPEFRVSAVVAPVAMVRAPESAMLLVVNVCEPMTVPVMKVPAPALDILVVPLSVSTPAVMATLPAVAVMSPVALVIPVAPVIAPAPVMSMDPEFIKLSQPVPRFKAEDVMAPAPLSVMLPTLIPLTVSVPAALVAVWAAIERALYVRVSVAPPVYTGVMSTASSLALVTVELTKSDPVPAVRVKLALASKVSVLRVEVESTLSVDVVEIAVVKASMPVSPVRVPLAVTVTKLALIGAYRDDRAVPPSEMEAKAAAPATDTDQLLSVKEKLVVEESPMVMVLA